jgi:hypothetical protein
MLTKMDNQVLLIVNINKTNKYCIVYVQLAKYTIKLTPWGLDETMTYKSVN